MKTLLVAALLLCAIPAQAHPPGSHLVVNHGGFGNHAFFGFNHSHGFGNHALFGFNQSSGYGQVIDPNPGVLVPNFGDYEVPVSVSAFRFTEISSGEHRTRIRIRGF